MRRKQIATAHFVVCLKNTGYPASLELHKIYRVVPDEKASETDDVRVIDESGEDFLYPASWLAEIRFPARSRDLSGTYAAAHNIG